MRRFLTLLTAMILASPAFAQPPVRLVSPQQEAQYRQAFPAVYDEDIAKLLASDDLVFYTEKEIPKAYRSQDRVTRK